jgi:stearoyl-CoA desaturase (delta-9 desaturase)
MDPTMDPAVGRVRFDAAKAAWLWTMIGTGAVGAMVATPAAVAVAAVLHVITLCIGHSVGLHRGTIHRAYRAGPIVRGALAYLGVLTGLGGPLTWARVHAVRDYWQNQPDCPAYFRYRHSLARDFLWYLHCRFEPRDRRAEHRLPPDLLSDPWLGFLERTWPLHALALALALAASLGPGTAAMIVGTRTALGFLGHWFIGYAAHRWGSQRFVIAGAPESGTNVWLLGVLSFGEGFHNNHHRYPASARMGLRWYELDLGYGVIRLLAALGLVQDVQA